MRFLPKLGIRPALTLLLTSTSRYATSVGDTEWVEISTIGNPTPRHEACFVFVDEKGYLIGGRGIKPVDVYDPETKTWTEKSGPGMELHHMQCVANGGKVWIVSAWTGGYPYEDNVDKIYVYDTESDTWSFREGLPEPRRRGGGAAVLYKDEIYVSHGNRGGHGSHATSLAWLDKYNIQEDTWYTNLPSAPNPRDHTGGAVVQTDGKDYLCIAGGRNGGEDDFFNKPVLQTDCYDLASGEWSVRADISQGRAGSAYGTTCDGKLMIAGGEGFGRAFDNVDVFDGRSWEAYPSLQTQRHGTGLAVSCPDGQVYIASGNIKQGGGAETTSTETLSMNGSEQSATEETPDPTP